MLNFNWPKILAASVVIIIFTGGLYYYSNYYLGARKAVLEFEGKLQETGELVFGMSNILQTDLPKSFEGLEEKEVAGDFQGASKIIDGSLALMDEFSKRNEALKIKTEEFKSSAKNLSDDNTRGQAEKTADILGRLILQFEEINGFERLLLNLAKNYYNALAVDQEAEAPDFIQINAKIAISSNNFSNLLGEFAIAANDLNSALGAEDALTKTEPTEGVKELKIEDVALGQSEEAKNGDTLVVHYEGYLEDGTKFDSSVDRGQAFTFVLGSGQVIQGWEQGLIGMKIGGHRRLTIPPELGYGARGQGAIPPNSTLIFEIDLLGIE